MPVVSIGLVMVFLGPMEESYGLSGLGEGIRPLPGGVVAVSKDGNVGEVVVVIDDVWKRVRSKLKGGIQ